jgi:hypothetical protein
MLDGIPLLGHWRSREPDQDDLYAVDLAPSERRADADRQYSISSLKFARRQFLNSLRAGDRRDWQRDDAQVSTCGTPCWQFGRPTQTLCKLQPFRGAVLRWALVPVFVAASHHFDWHFLRECTTDAILISSRWIGLAIDRINTDVIALNDLFVQFTVSCTLIDAFCGGIPLLWLSSISVVNNLGRLLLIFAVLCCLNIVRLEFGFVIYSNGVPWWLARECISGLIYFWLFLFVMKTASWSGEFSLAAPHAH